MMRGTLQVESIEGEGSTFFFNALFQIGAENATSPPSTIDPAPGGNTTDPSEHTPLRILFVEDNNFNKKSSRPF